MVSVAGLESDESSAFSDTCKLPGFSNEMPGMQKEG